MSNPITDLVLGFQGLVADVPDLVQPLIVALAGPCRSLREREPPRSASSVASTRSSPPSPARSATSSV